MSLAFDVSHNPSHAKLRPLWVCPYLGLHDSLLNVTVSVGVCNGVPNPNAVAFNHEEIVHHLLDVAVEVSGSVIAKLSRNDVHERSSLVSKSVLGQDATDQLSMLYDHLTKKGRK